MNQVDRAFAELSAAAYMAEHGGQPAREIVGDECWNLCASHVQAMCRDTPAKRWADLPPFHPALFRALRIDPADPGAHYAVLPFRLAACEQGHRIHAAWPCPRQLTDPEHDHLGVEVVLAWEPRGNAVEVVADPEPQLVGAFPDCTHGTLYADPFAFFRAWVELRAAFFVRWNEARRARWQALPEERDPLPGVLIVGDPARIRWNPTSLPAMLECVGADPRRIDRAIFKAARLPRVSGAAPMRRAA